MWNSYVYWHNKKWNTCSTTYILPLLNVVVNKPASKNLLSETHALIKTRAIVKTNVCSIIWFYCQYQKLYLGHKFCPLNIKRVNVHYSICKLSLFLVGCIIWSNSPFSSFIHKKADNIGMIVAYVIYRTQNVVLLCDTALDFASCCKALCAIIIQYVLHLYQILFAQFILNFRTLSNTILNINFWQLRNVTTKLPVIIIMLWTFRQIRTLLYTYKVYMWI